MMKLQFQIWRQGNHPGILKGDDSMNFATIGKWECKDNRYDNSL